MVSARSSTLTGPVLGFASPGTESLQSVAHELHSGDLGGEAVDDEALGGELEELEVVAGWLAQRSAEATVASKQTSTQRRLRATISSASSSSETVTVPPVRSTSLALSSAM